nr:uncharacterized protein LOC109174819 [Ipomoea batatas]
MNEDLKGHYPDEELHRGDQITRMDYYSTNDSGYGRPNYYPSRATRSPSQSRVLAEDSWPNHEVLGSWPRTRGRTKKSSGPGRGLEAETRGFAFEKMKCNVDAALVDDIVSFGAVLRDHGGKFVAACAAKLIAKELVEEDMVAQCLNPTNSKLLSSKVAKEKTGLRKDVIFIFLLTQLNPVALSRAPWLTPKDAPVGKIELGLEGNLGAGPSGLFGFVGYDGFEAGYGLVKGNAGEVDVGNNGEGVEDDDVEIKLGGVEGVVELAAEVVVTSAGVRLAEVVGDFGCDLGVIEEGERRRLGEGE